MSALLGGILIVSVLRFFSDTMLLKQQQYCTVFSKDLPPTSIQHAQHIPNNQVPKFSAA